MTEMCLGAVIQYYMFLYNNVLNENKSLDYLHNAIITVAKPSRDPMNIPPICNIKAFVPRCKISITNLWIRIGAVYQGISYL